MLPELNSGVILRQPCRRRAVRDCRYGDAAGGSAGDAEGGGGAGEGAAKTGGDVAVRVGPPADDVAWGTWTWWWTRNRQRDPQREVKVNSACGGVGGVWLEELELFFSCVFLACFLLCAYIGSSSDVGGVYVGILWYLLYSNQMT